MSCAGRLPDARAWMVCRAEGKRWYTKAPLPRAFPSATAVACPGNLTPVKAVNRPQVAPATVKQLKVAYLQTTEQIRTQQTCSFYPLHQVWQARQNRPAPRKASSKATPSPLSQATLTMPLMTTNAPPASPLERKGCCLCPIFKRPCCNKTCRIKSIISST